MIEPSSVQVIATKSYLGSIYSNTNLNEFTNTINSILDCIDNFTEIVLVVDGPINKSLYCCVDGLKKYPFISILELPINMGLGNALNKGLELCSGDYIFRFDTDDIYLPFRVPIFMDCFASNHSLDIIGSSIIEFSTSQKSYVNCLVKRVPLDHQSIVFQMNYKNPINHPSVAFKRKSIVAIGGYPCLPLFEDYALWLKARSLNLSFSNIDVNTVAMRRPLTYERRYGLSYLNREFKFYLWAVKNNYISIVFLPVFMIRLLSRLLPKRLQRIQRFLPWRSPSLTINNPDINKPDFDLVNFANAGK